MGDEIARLDARFIRRGAVNRGDDFYKAVFLRDLNTKAAEFATRLFAHLCRILWRKVAGVRIKRRQHAVNRRLDQGRAVHFFHILRANPLEYVAKQVQLLVNVVGFRCFLRKQGGRDLCCGDNPCNRTAGSGHQKLLHFSIHPCRSGTRIRDPGGHYPV